MPIRPSIVRLLLSAVLACAACAAVAAPPPFHAPAVTSGSVEVRLHATEAVAAGVPTLITFGVPFPRGSLTPAQLSTVRVLRGAQEVPAFVEALTPWRHRYVPAHDGTSVRVVRIQIEHAFAAVYPQFDAITVQWGGAARTQSRPALVDPRSDWHPVTSGSFVAGDGVTEPDAYAVLPADWLSRGTLKQTRSQPFAADNPHARDDPATNDAIAHWPGYQEAERAHKNAFYSHINRDDVRVVTPQARCQYGSVTDVAYANFDPREPWLYDRAATMFALYFRSGSFIALREAVQATQFYAGRLDANGYFTLAPGDSKYAYNESISYAYWLTGDDTLREPITRVVTAHDGFPLQWTAARNFWTERHAAFKVLALVFAYEVDGGTARRAALENALATLRAHQDGAGGAIPPQAVDGGLYHYGRQHDYDYAEDRLGGSSWMSALVSDAVVRAYATGEDAATAHFVRRLGTFLQATMAQTAPGDHSYDTNAALWVPRYALLSDGTTGEWDFADTEHALDVAGQLAWAWYFSQVVDQPTQAFSDSVARLYATYDEGVNHWIRPGGPAAGLPAFRVSPWRRWGWEHRTSDSIGFAMSTGGIPPVFHSGFE